MKITIIGDVHGKHDKYYKIASQAEATIQIGDLGFNYKVLQHLDPNLHKVVPGNHDNYDIVAQYEHILPTFGTTKHCGLNFFYVRGGFSIDWKYRLKQEERFYVKSWWPEEELDNRSLEKAIKLYEKVKPDFMISHECPRSIVNHITDGRVLKDFGYNPKTFTTRTSEALQVMFDIHQPKEWFFGHYHRSLIKNINGTQFHCLAELETYEVEV